MGLTNDLAPVLGKRLVELADSDNLTRCFFSDDGATAVEAVLDLLQSDDCQRRQASLSAAFVAEREKFWTLPVVGDVRQEGCILAVELVKNFATREPFDATLRLGARVCEAAKKHGLLTRPVGDTLLLMPPYTTTPDEAALMVSALVKAVGETVVG